MPLNLEDLLGALGSRLGGALGGGGSPFHGDFRLQSFSPFAGLGAKGSPFKGGLNSQGSPFAGKNLAAPSPFQGGQFGAQGSPFRGPMGMGGSVFGNPLAGLTGRNPYLPNPNDPATRAAGATAPTGGANGAWTGAATAADNATLTPEKVEQVIAQTRPNSPLKGLGGWLLTEANRRNISLPEFMGIMLAESELGTTAGPGWGALVGLGGAGGLSSYPSLQAAVTAGMDNLAGSLYAGKSLEEHIGYWFAGPQAWAANGLDASDGVNGTVRDYITGKVAPMYAALGVPLQQSAKPTARTTNSGLGGASGWSNSITPGTPGQIMQEFGRTDYSDAHPDTYAYGSSYGVQGHPGVDWAVGMNTRTTTPVGGTVFIVGNDHGTGYFYKNTMSNSNPDTSGEFAIQLDNGDILILGHMSNITVRVGQRLNAGDFIGYSGGSDGAHIHVEYRKKNPAYGSGYQAVDPRQYIR